MCDDTSVLQCSHKENPMTTKICCGCKVLLPFESFSKDKARKDGLRYKCKSCSAQEFKNFKDSPGYVKRLRSHNEHRDRVKREDPIKGWAHTAFHNAKRRAKDAGIEFSITKEWLISNAIEFCPLLDLKLVYNAKKPIAASASVDRKDSTGGYTMENCKVISFKANRIKSNATIEEITMLANRLQQY